MTITDFKIGEQFWFNGGEEPWKCYDVGTRVVVACPCEEDYDGEGYLEGDDLIVFDQDELVFCKTQPGEAL